jgi:8-amino-7-oxononanoate synthase
VLDTVRTLGLVTPNRSGLPVIELPIGAAGIAEVGQFLYDRSIYVTLAPYPLVPRDEVGVRIQVTAANTDAEIDTLNAVLIELADRFELPREQA